MESTGKCSNRPDVVYHGSEEYVKDTCRTKVRIGVAIFTGSIGPVFIGLLIFLSLATPVSAELATPEEMEMVCRNWLTYIVSQTGDWAGSTNPEIAGVQDIIENDTLLARYYAVSPGGYVIVPALKELPPVKAYTENYGLDIDEPGGMAVMIREVLSQRMRLFAEVYGSLEIAQPQSDQPLFDAVNGRKWDQLAVGTEAFAADKSPAETLEEAGPLLKTAWHQNAPYNNLCPLGDGDRCLVGCVATAAAQIVWYYAWPPYGNSETSYYWYGDYSCDDSTPGRTLYADYSDPYQYESTADMAELCYEMGVAYQMNYGACASGAWTMEGQWIYPYYFRYLDTTYVNYRDNHTPASWFQLIKNEINMRRPILYQIPRHAIVCDGWRVADGLDQYHFNYGWGGSQNAWYTVDNLFCNWEGCEDMYEVMLTRIIPDRGIACMHSDGFSDDITGNGDGVFEAGEEVALNLTVVNYGGAAINDLSVTLTIDDASLNITNGSFDVGSIAPFDSITNAAAPFTFQIPIDYAPRIDSFTLALSWDGGAEVDTIILEQTVGAPAILLVEDDISDHAGTYYRQELERYRIPYDVWEASVSTPTSTDLEKYDIVFWYTGNYRPDPLNLAEVAAMQGYMDGGGQLFLSGQAIAAQLSTLDAGFLSGYLRAVFKMTKPISTVPVLEGLAGLICDTTDIIALVSGDGAGNQQYPDLIDSINGGIPEFEYIGQEYFGWVSYAGDYKSIFLSFGFEAVIEGNYRWTYRSDLFSRVLNFFNYQRPGAPPMAADLGAGPGDPAHLLDHTPEFSWTYYDGNAAIQTMYQVQVGDNADWSAAEMWDSGPIGGEATSIAYGGQTLEDGETYYVRARVNNGTFWSDWTDAQFHMNSVPSIPGTMNPSDMAGVVDIEPEMILANAIDADDDALTYAFEIYEDSLMNQMVADIGEWPQGNGGVTSWTPPVSLTEDATYYWRGRADDSFESGSWTPLASFWVNADNQMPSAVDLLSPADGAGLEYSNPKLVWTPATDNDPYDRVQYTLYYSSDSTFAQGAVIPGLDTTAYVVDPLPPAAAYYWKVVACDLFGGETTCNQVFSFSMMVAGDANGDGSVDVGDAVYLINYVFRDGPGPDPNELGDANCDAFVNVGDAVYLINYIFRSGPEPGCI